MEVEINVDRLHRDLLEHFGTSQFWCSAHAPHQDGNNPWYHRWNEPMVSGCSIATGALGDIDTMYETGNYQELVNLAVQEGFDIISYQV